MIKKSMRIGEITMKHPKAIPIMLKAGLHCIGCQIAGMETLEQGCLAHGMNEKEIKKLVEEMNKELKKKEK